MDNQFTFSAYSNYLNEHKLMGSRDKASGAAFLPPRPLNPENFSTDMEWVEFSGKGKLSGFTIVYIAPTAMIEAGYDRKNPYCVGIVETDEGPMVSSFIMDVDVLHPETIQIGMPVKAAFIDRGTEENKQAFLAFQPV
ncbi:MAG: Zn-ribbon domain-containing OB-fold protein [Anaerolineaceae bacterium]|nr:Zn-ribbon domain-containing OB-fold protein [Anaerolineaceae bacterium]